MGKILGLLALAATALTLAACGGGDDGTSTVADAGAGDDGFPLKVSQAIGDVTIEAPPVRVVALDYPSADAALALGVVPVGMYNVSYVEGGVQEWTRRALERLGGEEPELIDTEAGFPFETIQRLEPDVILATNTFPLIEESWDQLNAIAPVVGHVEGPGIDDWRQGMRRVARALGKEAEGRRAIAAVEAKIAAARKRYPQLAGKTVSIFNYVPGDNLYVISEDADASIRFFKQLGLAGVAPSVAALPSTEGRAAVSAERYPEIDADVVIGTSPDPEALAELEGERVFEAVPAVARGAYFGADIGEATAMAFPSVLSVPYAIEKLAGRVAAAAAAGGG
ncbi:MAG TPA: ABC transporter substrate-binding protein, partial [Solirubrobacterales bacterium]|nr:ABC transporter substrate-binding protein [Solirubrobacterales bacterium]